MNILSLKENNSIKIEADLICSIIESHAKPLREGNVGKRVNIDGIIFELFRSDRNIIYRIRSKFSWFLKMPCRGKVDGINREISGAAHIKKQFKLSGQYYHAEAIRASVEKKYILYAEVPGMKLNMKIYSTCFKPKFRFIDDCRKIFYNFGRVQAELHNNAKAEKIDHTNRNAGVVLKKAINNLTKHSFVTGAVEFWAEHHFLEKPKHDNALIHANLHPENVLICGDKVCFIDFENFGVGSIYEDISQIVSHLTLTRALMFFPWKRAQLIIDEILQGYKSVSNFKREILYRYVTARICIYYLQRFCSQPTKSRISGIPIKKEKLEWIILRLLDEEYEEVFTGFRI